MTDDTINPNAHLERALRHRQAMATRWANLAIGVERGTARLNDRRYMGKVNRAGGHALRLQRLAVEMVAPPARGLLQLGQRLGQSTAKCLAFLIGGIESRQFGGDRIGDPAGGTAAGRRGGGAAGRRGYRHSPQASATSATAAIRTERGQKKGTNSGSPKASKAARKTAAVIVTPYRFPKNCRISSASAR